MLQGIGVSLLSGNNGSCWTVAVLVKEDSGMVGGAWCGIIGDDKGCDGGGCTWAGVVDCWCCLFVSSNYI